MKSWLLILFFLVCLPAHPAGAQGPDTGDSPYQRVVSLGPLITDMVYLLEADDALAGVSSYCTIPAGHAPKDIIGTVMQMNLEKVVSLQPEVVFASTLTRPKQVQSLKNQGIRVIKFDNPGNFEEICSMFLALGRLLGKETRAKDIVRQAGDQVAAIEARVSNLERRTVFIQIGIRPLRTSEPGTFISDYIERAGGINIAKMAGSGVYSREDVLRQNPDVILVATMGSSTKAAENEKARWLSLSVLKAAKNNEIHVLDPDLVCSPTPVTFVHALEVFFSCIHPGQGPEGS